MAKFNWQYFRETHKFTKSDIFGAYKLYETDWYYYIPNAFTNIPSYINTTTGHSIELPNDTDKYVYKYCFKNFVLYKDGTILQNRLQYDKFFKDYFAAINVSRIYVADNQQQLRYIFNGTLPDVPLYNTPNIKNELFPTPVFTEDVPYIYLNNEKVYNISYLNPSTDETPYFDSDNIYIGDRTAPINLNITTGVPRDCTVPLWIPVEQVDTPIVSCGSVRIGYQVVDVPFFGLAASTDNFKYLGYSIVVGIEEIGG